MSYRPRFRQVFACTLAVALSVPSVAVSQSDDETSTQARILYDQGRAALRADRPESARLVLERAYQLRPTPQIGFALGMAELDMGLFVEAASHMAVYMHQFPNPTREEKKAFAEAERNVAHLMFDVNVDRTRIYIDNENMGVTPFVFQPVYVLAGRHVIRATNKGFKEVTQTYDVIAGRRTDVKIVLEPEPVVPESSSSSPQVDGGAPSIASAASTHQPPLKVDRPHRFDTRTIIVAGGSILTVGSGIFALVEGLRASSANSDVHDLSRTLGTPYACSSSSIPGCAGIAEASQRHDDALQLMRIAIVGTAILGGATVASWFLWPHSRGTVSVTPQVHPTMTGLVVTGSLQ